MILVIGIIISGIIIATIATAIGIGGGILWMPLLLIVYKLNPQEAITTSLFIQIIGMGSGTLAYYRLKRIQTKLVLILSAAAIPGVIIGSFITINMHEQTIKMWLGIMSLILALLFVASNSEHIKASTNHYSNKDVISILPIPAIFGFIVGSLSLGISEWLIPALRDKLKLDMTTSIATVIPSMFILAILASSLHFGFSDTLHIQYFIYGAIGTIIGAQIGANISKRINERMLKQAFIYLMTLIGIHLIYNSL